MSIRPAQLLSSSRTAFSVCRPRGLFAQTVLGTSFVPTGTLRHLTHSLRGILPRTVLCLSRAAMMTGLMASAGGCRTPSDAYIEAQSTFDNQECVEKLQREYDPRKEKGIQKLIQKTCDYQREFYSTKREVLIYEDAVQKAVLYFNYGKKLHENFRRKLQKTSQKTS